MTLELTPSTLLRKAIVAALILAIVAFLIHSWLVSRDDLARMAATLAGQKELIAAADQRERQRAADLRQQLAQISDLKRRVNTPQQIVRELPQFLNLPQPIQILPAGNAASAPSAPARPAEQGSGLPEKPRPAGAGGPEEGSGGAAAATGEVAQFPAEDLKTLFDYVQDCRACQAKLAADESNIADERNKNEALRNERDAALKAAKGGSFWARTRRAVKWFAIGAAAGAILARSAHH